MPYNREREELEAMRKPWSELHLRPCPFCGGRGFPARHLRDGYDDYQDDPDAFAHFIRCITCAAEGPWCKSNPEGAATQWNRRVKEKSDGIDA